MSVEGQRPLSREDWAQAALGAIARGGVSAVAVETLATELGATKGSFYWHFPNRDAVVAAALELWERRRTEAVIEWLEREPEPARRLRALLASALELGPTDRTEVALLGHPGHPLAVAAVRRVAERRVAYIAGQLEALGRDAQDARDRALLLHHVYAGYLQMSHVAPGLMTDHARHRHLELLLDAVVGGDALLGGTPPAAGAAQHGPSEETARRRSD